MWIANKHIKRWSASFVYKRNEKTLKYHCKPHKSSLKFKADHTQCCQAGCGKTGILIHP
jgi:hypothetical protein